MIPTLLIAAALAHQPVKDLEPMRMHRVILPEGCAWVTSQIDNGVVYGSVVKIHGTYHERQAAWYVIPEADAPPEVEPTYISDLFPGGVWTDPNGAEWYPAKCILRDRAERQLTVGLWTVKVYGGTRYYQEQVVIDDRLPVLSADFNGDGIVDTRDVTDFLNVWNKAQP